MALSTIIIPTPRFTLSIDRPRASRPLASGGGQESWTGTPGSGVSCYRTLAAGGPLVLLGSKPSLLTYHSPPARARGNNEKSVAFAPANGNLPARRPLQGISQGLYNQGGRIGKKRLSRACGR